MCGRFYLDTEKAKVAEYFHIDGSSKTVTNFNIAPSYDCTVVRLKNQNKDLAKLKWGLVPSWAKSDIKVKPINAKAETLKEKPFFRSAFKKHRCIIPASGFYEWKGSKGNKQPYAIYPLNDPYFGFAGLWEKQDNLETFTIITTEANDVMKEIHHRMPVILDSDNYDEWLEQGSYDLLKPSSSDEIGCHMISSKVNKPINNSPDLLSPI